MPGDNGRRGLCLNCINAPQCTYPAAPDRYVTQCEEFSCNGSFSEGSLTEGSSASRILMTATLRSARDEKTALNHTRYEGLCQICKNAPQCTFPRSHNRTVAQCEEYDWGEPV